MAHAAGTFRVLSGGEDAYQAPGEGDAPGGPEVSHGLEYELG